VWKEEKFLKHFYASYLLASVKLVPGKLPTGEEFRDKRFASRNKEDEDRYVVFQNYKVQNESFLYIALKMLQENQ
jgi:hypothetical protein